MFDVKLSDEIPYDLAKDLLIIINKYVGKTILNYLTLPTDKLIEVEIFSFLDENEFDSGLFIVEITNSFSI